LQRPIGHILRSAPDDRGQSDAAACLSTPEHALAEKPLGIAGTRARLGQEGQASLGRRLDSGRPRVARYHLIERLGRGSQGEVWKAVQLEPPIELVALKLLTPTSRRDPAKLARFRREAERGAKLASPAILPTYEFGEDGGVVFFAMPLVKGFALNQVLDQRRKYRAGRPPLHLHRLAVLSEQRYIDAMVRILARVAWALEDAHAAKVVHCDVKPANILLDRGNDERAYLIDFGMGRDLDAMPKSPMLGAAGTVLYMAPEKLSGRLADEVVCDVYALGATAFEALALKPPRVVPEDVPRSHWAKYLSSAEPPRPSKIFPRLPDRLEAILARALAEDPNRRYSSSAAMARDLDLFLDGTRLRRGPDREAR
jgi:eukaryotic-like serine/threonine-protein kinase